MVILKTVNKKGIKHLSYLSCTRLQSNQIVAEKFPFIEILRLINEEGSWIALIYREKQAFYVQPSVRRQYHLPAYEYVSTALL